MGSVAADAVSGAVLRDDGAAHPLRLSVVNEGQPSGWPARAFPHGRPRQSACRADGHAEEARQRRDGRGRPCAPGTPGTARRSSCRARGPATAAATAALSRRSAAVLSVRGSRGRSHPPAPCVHKEYAAHDNYRCHEPVFVSSDRAVRLPLFTARIAFVPLRGLLVFAVPLDALPRPISCVPDTRPDLVPA